MRRHGIQIHTPNHPLPPSTRHGRSNTADPTRATQRGRSTSCRAASLEASHSQPHRHVRHQQHTLGRPSNRAQEQVPTQERVDIRRSTPWVPGCSRVPGYPDLPRVEDRHHKMFHVKRIPCSTDLQPAETGMEPCASPCGSCRSRISATHHDGSNRVRVTMLRKVSTLTVNTPTSKSCCVHRYLVRLYPTLEANSDTTSTRD